MKKVILPILSAIILIAVFQNCGDVQMQPTSNSSSGMVVESEGTTNEIMSFLEKTEDGEMSPEDSRRSICKKIFDGEFHAEYDLDFLNKVLKFLGCRSDGPPRRDLPPVDDPNKDDPKSDDPPKDEDDPVKDSPPERMVKVRNVPGQKMGINFLCQPYRTEEIYHIQWSNVNSVDECLDLCESVTAADANRIFRIVPLGASCAYHKESHLALPANTCYVGNITGAFANVSGTWCFHGLDY